MSTRDILERWRPSATPGPPTAAGVPADRVAERSAELEAVLSLLTEAQAEADRIRSDAAAEADRRRAAGHERARALIAEAHRTARSERSAAAAAAEAAGAAAADEIRDRATQESLATLARARARQPALVAAVAARAREELAAMTEPGA